MMLAETQWMLSRPLTGYLPLGTHAYHTPDSKCCQYLCRWSSAVIQMASAAHLGAWKLCRQERLPGSSSQIMDSVRIVRDARLHKAIVLQEGVIALGPIADEHLLSLHRPILKRQQPISLCQCTSRAVPRHIQELVSSHFILYLCISGDSGCLQHPQRGLTFLKELLQLTVKQFLKYSNSTLLCTSTNLLDVSPSGAALVSRFSVHTGSQIPHIESKRSLTMAGILMILIRLAVKTKRD